MGSTKRFLRSTLTDSDIWRVISHWLYHMTTEDHDRRHKSNQQPRRKGVISVMATLWVPVASSLLALQRFKYMHSADSAARLAEPCAFTSCGTTSPHSSFCAELQGLTFSSCTAHKH